MIDAEPMTSPGLGTAVYHDVIRINRAVRMRTAPGTLAAGSVSTLWTVVQHAPVRTTELAERENVAAPTMSRIVASLEKQGMIRRGTDPTDKRVSLISPTDDGVRYIHGVTSGKARMFETALAHMSASDRVEVERSLNLLADTLLALDESP